MITRTNTYSHVISAMYNYTRSYDIYLYIYISRNLHEAVIRQYPRPQIVSRGSRCKWHRPCCPGCLSIPQAAVSQSVVIMCIYNTTLRIYTVTFRDWRNRIIIIIMIFPRLRDPVAFILFSLLFIMYIY